MSIRFIFTVLFFLPFTFAAEGQNINPQYSLLQKLKTAKEDESKVLLLFRIGQEFENSDLEKAKSYYWQARALGQKINYALTEVKFISNYTFALNMQGLLDSSLFWNLEGIEEAKKLKSNEQLAKAYFNTGTAFQYMSDYKSATEYYQKGLTYAEKLDDKLFMAQANDILQNLYTNTRQFDKAKIYGKNAIAAFRKADNLKLLAYSLTNLGVIYGKTNQKDSSLIYHKEADAIAKNIKDEILIATTEINLADVYLWKKQYELAKKYFSSVLQSAKRNNLPGSEVGALRGLSYCYTSSGEYEKAHQYAQKALAVSQKNNLIEDEVLGLHQLASLAYFNKDIDKANNYETRAQVLRDSLLNTEIVTNTINIEKKYELDKKNIQLKLQEGQIKQKNLLNGLLIGGFLSVLLIAFLGYRNYNQRKKNQEQRINELETEKQLLATQSLVKGQEEERSRIAKDLHDGLGGLLSGVKLQLGAMKGNLILTEENGNVFNRALDKLDESISEMRRVAHNMMPETLLKFGLQQALLDYGNGLSHQQNFNIQFEFRGLENRMDNSTEVVIYRIVQELINNAVKHSGATNILAQVMRHDNNQLNITVEDNGNGFDPEKIKRNLQVCKM